MSRGRAAPTDTEIEALLARSASHTERLARHATPPTRARSRRNRSRRAPIHAMISE